MNFNYHFSNLLGTVYRHGDLIFSPDGNTLFSPVGNKISAFDLKSHTSGTLNIEGRFDYTTLALSPNGVLLLAANEDGEVHLISLVSKTILKRLRINRPILALSFSPDGKQFALAKENLVLIYRTPGASNKDYNAFGLDRVLKGALDDISSLNWSSCSRILAVGSKDNTTRLYPLREKYSNFKSYCLGGHSDPIVATFFEKDSLICYTISRNGHLVLWEPSLNLDELIPLELENQTTHKSKKKNSKENEGEQDDDVDPNNLEDEPNEANVETDSANADTTKASKLFYSRKSKTFLRDALPGDKDAKTKKTAVDVTAVDYHTELHLLVTGINTIK